jgi:radical SAM superfamily enzyme YgiQ (UPF0313 family)
VGTLAPKLERRRTGDVVSELESYAAAGVEDAAFFDDALLWDAERHIKPILARLSRLALPLRLHTPNGLHARYVDEETARGMRAANFKTIRLSLESVSDERLREWDDKVSYDDFVKAVANLREAGFATDELGSYVMTGVVGENFDETARSIAAAHAARFDVTEPLLQNNTIIPAVDEAGFRRCLGLKDFAKMLNRELAKGKILFSRSEVERPAAGFAARVGV